MPGSWPLADSPLKLVTSSPVSSGESSSWSGKFLIMSGHSLSFVLTDGVLAFMISSREPGVVTPLVTPMVAIIISAWR